MPKLKAVLVILIVFAAKKHSVEFTGLLSGILILAPCEVLISDRREKSVAHLFTLNAEEAHYTGADL